MSGRLCTALLVSALALLAEVPAAPAADLSISSEPGLGSAPTAPALPFFLHVGAAGLFLDESATVRAGGAIVPGGTISIADQAAFAFEFGYRFTPDLAVAFAGGFPSLSKIEGAGALAGIGTVGKTMGGPMAVHLQYHLPGWGAFQPYLGVGAVFLSVFDNEDGALSHFRVRESFGASLQAGVDYMLDDHWGLFVDVKKAFLRTTSVGYLGPVRVDSNVVLDSVALHSGVTYRF